MKKGGKMSKTNRNENNKKDDFSNQRAEKIASGIPARSAGLLLCLFISLAAAFSLTGPLRAQAGTGSSKTKVIKTTTDESFAIQSAKLAKKNPGLTVKTTGKARPYSSARLIVGLKSGKKVDFSKYKAATVVESSFGVSIVQFSSESAAKKAAASLKKLSSVRYVDADDCTLDLGDYEVKKIYYDESSYEKDMGASALSGEAADADTYDKSQLNNFDYTYEETVKQNEVSVSSSAMSWGVSVIEADKYAAYVKACTSRSVKVAVVDSGVSYHKKMDGRILSGIDLIDDDYTPTDQNGHGTHVAGTIVDCTPGIKVFILPVRVMNASGAGSPSVVGNGIRYAVSKGAKVINLSLGGYSHYQYLEDCINYAHNNGVTVVIASGNENENTKYVCPAHMTNPIIVGSINRNKKRSSFSNYGDSLDLVAPGEDIVSCWMGGGYAVASGTSMAAPHISGVAAMYRLMYPTYGSSKTIIMLRTFVRDLGQTGTDIYYGRGTPMLTGPIKPTKVTLDKKTAKIEIKKTLSLKATIAPSYAGQKKLTWSSSNTAVATVSSSGKVTAKKKGTSTITIEAIGGKKASCKVTVIGIQPVSVTSSLKSKKLEVGSSVTLKATVSPSNAENKTLTWSSSNSAVAVVSSSGKVTAKKKGTATITVKTVNGKKATCKVTVIGIQPHALNLNLSAKKLEVGSFVTLKATVSPSNAENKTVTWGTEATSIATVQGGVVKAKGEGSVTITATTVNGKKATCKVTVIPQTEVKASAKSQPMALSGEEELSLMPSAAAQEAPADDDFDSTPARSAAAEEENASVAPVQPAEAEEEEYAFVSPVLSVAIEEEEAYTSPVQSAVAEEENSYAVPVQSAEAEEEEYAFASPVLFAVIEEEEAYASPVQSAAAEENIQEDIPSPPDQSGEEEEGNLFAGSDLTAEEEDSSDETGLATEGEETGNIVDPDSQYSIDPEAGNDPSAEQQLDESPSLFLEKEVYTAASGEGSVEFLADIRLPGPADPLLNGQAEQYPADSGENPAAAAQIRDTDYVLAMLREEQDGTKTLLGAVDLTSSLDEDKMYFSTGILSRTGIVKNEGTWALSLRADLSPWTEKRAPWEQEQEQGQNYEQEQEQDQIQAQNQFETEEKEPSGDYCSERIEECDTAAYTERMTAWNCTLAVYDRQSFEEREYASSIPDPESCILIDAGALCSCPFTLNINTAPASDEEELFTDADI